ncbi:hypothetical protein ODY75_20315, partial [Shewanella xiamenensis]|uniref:hypothetical protein n=1 Tax=Shewanella xiamenensis TaxID=332186 RepID=UPI0024A6D728
MKKLQINQTRFKKDGLNKTNQAKKNIKPKKETIAENTYSASDHPSTLKRSATWLRTKMQLALSTSKAVVLLNC